RHRHAVGMMRVADRSPRRETDGDRLPAAAEAETQPGVDVDAEVGLDRIPAQFDVVSALRLAEVHEIVRIFSIAADQPFAEALNELGADDRRKLVAGELAMERIGADQRDVSFVYPGATDTIEHGIDRH